jgi:hypothetical protein
MNQSWGCRYILQWTYFVPLVIFDAMRDEDSRVDCVPCAKWKKPDNARDDEHAVADRSFADKIVQKFYAPYLVKLPVAIAVVRTL